VGKDSRLLEKLRFEASTQDVAGHPGDLLPIPREFRRKEDLVSQLRSAGQIQARLDPQPRKHRQFRFPGKRRHDGDGEQRQQDDPNKLKADHASHNFLDRQ
jgi:hypothetical protein